MHGNTRSALLGYGLPSDLIDEISACGHTLGELRALSRKKLLALYRSEAVDQIKARVERTPIPEATIEAVVSKAGCACCYCNDGNSTRPFQIHHVDPYSQTQDNSEDNLLLVCPTHHATIHENCFSRAEQKSVRRGWQATVEIASDFAAKGLSFPFETFQALDYESDAKPAELVEFGPLSPSTALVSYPAELAATARTLIESASFLLVMGDSGSGKSTYVTALGGLYAKDGFKVFRHCFSRQCGDALKKISLFISTCVRKATIILDDANTWATAAKLQEIAKLVSGVETVLVIATWTADDSDDVGRLQACDLPKQALTWPDLRPVVVESLLRYEGHIVESLEKHERGRGIGSLGLGSLHTPLKDRILALGHKPRTVYEFIFGLRGDVAVAEEFRQLVHDNRADVPVLHLAIEQIAGFERPVSIEEAVAACHRVEKGSELPCASSEWVRDSFQRQVRCKRLIAVRDRYTTIHRKWGARLIEAGLSSAVAKSTTEALLQPDFEPGSADPARLLRLWGWLEDLNQGRPFIRKWAGALSLDDWAFLVTRSARAGLTEVACLAGKMHRLSYQEPWIALVRSALGQNVAEIAPLVYSTSPTSWYWLRELSMAMTHACPSEWKELLLGWDRGSVANLLLETPINQFENVTWALSNAKRDCPGWLEQVGKKLHWDDFSPRLSSVEAGDLRGLFAAFGGFIMFGHILRRSMLRTLLEAIKNALRPATLENLRLPTMDSTLRLLTTFFPEDTRAAFAVLNVQGFGHALDRSLPRHWRTMLEMSFWTGQCNSTLCEDIIGACNCEQFEQQVRRFGPSNPYELRLALHFMRKAVAASRRSLAVNLRDVVCGVCERGDSEAQAILTAYVKLDGELGAAVAAQFGVVPDEIAEVSREGLEAARQEFRNKDASGVDYEIGVSDDSATVEG